MFNNGGGAFQLGNVSVATTSNCGLSVDHWAESCLRHIVYVGEDASPVIKDQALAYKKEIKKVLVLYMERAIKSDHTTLYNLLTQAGEIEAAELIRRLK